LTESKDKLGLIAGNGRFPFLLLDAARAHGTKSWSRRSKKRRTRKWMRARPRIQGCAFTGCRSAAVAADRDVPARGVHKAVMAGQVKHKQIFSSIRRTGGWRSCCCRYEQEHGHAAGAVAKVLGMRGSS